MSNLRKAVNNDNRVTVDIFNIFCRRDAFSRIIITVMVDVPRVELKSRYEYE